MWEIKRKTLLLKYFNIKKATCYISVRNIYYRSVADSEYFSIYDLLEMFLHTLFEKQETFGQLNWIWYGSKGASVHISFKI